MMRTETLASDILFPRLADLQQDDGSRASSADQSSNKASVLRTAALAAADLLSFGMLLFATALVLMASDFGAGRTMSVAQFAAFASAHGAGAILVGIIMVAKGQYTERSSFWCEARRLTGASALAALIVLLWPFEHAGSLSRLAAAGLWLLVPAWTIAMRKKARVGLDRLGLWRLPVVLLAPTEAMERVAQVVNSQHPFDFDIVQHIPLDRVDLETLHGWKALLAQHQACRLIVAASPGTRGYDRVLDTVVQGRIPFMVVFESGSLPVYGGHDTRMLRSDSVLVSYQVSLSRPVIRSVKIAMDFCLASLLMLLFAPLMLGLAGLIAMDGGPVFFAHERIGKGGKRFRCLKFRSMAVNADEILTQTLAQNPAALAEWKATRKLQRDPRITRIGRLLRSTSLDELPQLFNVLRLEMSLVGPRPIVHDEVSRYAEDIVFYHETRPGLTGLWQVSGRSDTSYEQRVAYDRWYVKNWTLWHDIVILGLTIPAVVARSGAR